MGNSNNSFKIRTAIINKDMSGLIDILLKSPSALNEVITEKGDTPLMVASRHGCAGAVRVLLDAGADINRYNRESRTALDLAIASALPADGNILQRYRAQQQQDLQQEVVAGPGGTQQRHLGETPEIPDVVEVLMEAGARGRSLERLILYVMRDQAQMRKIIEIIGDVDDPRNFRISGLLLQIAVWFEQSSNLALLLAKGVDMQHFWSASFMPRIEPSGHFSHAFPSSDEEEEEEEEYVISPVYDSDPLQELKFLFVQEWWADWNDGENPCAQYRAGLHLTPECAVFFVRAANSAVILSHIMCDVMQYLPPVCSGPDLKNSSLLNCLTMAGYIFSADEQQHLRLKFHVDFEPHLNFHKRPKKLRHLCRISIRFNFRTNVHLAVESLSDLPVTLREFLLLESDINL